MLNGDQQRISQLETILLSYSILPGTAAALAEKYPVGAQLGKKYEF